MRGCMENRTSDVRELILERVFPELRYGEDPDIERYFDLRASGRMLDAIGIYKSRLRPRYPDDAKRIILLKLYRTHAPAFSEFLHGLLAERADEIIMRLRGNIDALIAPLSGIPMKETYAVLKAVERVARLLPDNADAARLMATTYADYAKLLGHKKDETERVAFLLGEFYDQASVDEDAPTDFIAASLASEESRKLREHEAEKKNFFDLSRIEFDQADIKRIEIPAGIERDEDVVLAYCHKYWLRADDPAFERIVWLYSRKYGTKNYEVFKAIKTGRHRKYQDDDILTMVSTTIATRYNYTVQGDLYMQAAWRRIKASLYGLAAAQQVIHQTAQRAAEQSVKPEPDSVRTATRKTSQPEAMPATKPAKNMQKPVRPAKTVPRPARTVQQTAKPRAHKPATRQALVAAQPQRKLVRAPASALLQREKPQRDVLPEIKATGSISDKIKRLSGRAYDVYKEIFLSKVRSHIHTALAKSRIRPGVAFGDDANKAENTVYDFMERNYANTYMNWQVSEHRSRIRELGYDIESLDEIIESCYRKIEK